MSVFGAGYCLRPFTSGLVIRRPIAVGDMGRPSIGRPLTLTPQLADVLVDIASHGTPMQTCAEYAGIGVNTLRAWINKGVKVRDGHGEFAVEAVEAGEDIDAVVRKAEQVVRTAPNGDVYLEFALRFLKARATFEVQLLKDLRADDSMRWQRFAWLLERTRQDKYALRVRDHDDSDMKDRVSDKFRERIAESRKRYKDWQGDTMQWSASKIDMPSAKRDAIDKMKKKGKKK